MSVLSGFRIARILLFLMILLVVVSVAKQRDFATNMLTGPYKESGLAPLSSLS